MSDKQKQITAAVVTAVIVAWVIMVSGCSTVVPVCDPMYGPHVHTTKTNHEWDIERRNIYSDGWQDRAKAERLIREE